ncbi:MAG: hypothetical protein HYX76_03995 [Acidobacteria bacterium]|nr:hypothetical protein [Acidobacteriota bacterium]
MRRSPARHVERVRKLFTRRRLYRCRDCGWRGWGERTTGGAKRVRRRFLEVPASTLTVDDPNLELIVVDPRKREPRRRLATSRPRPVTGGVFAPALSTAGASGIGLTRPSAGRSRRDRTAAVVMTTLPLGVILLLLLLSRACSPYPEPPIPDSDTGIDETGTERMPPPLPGDLTIVLDSHAVSRVRS